MHVIEHDYKRVMVIPPYFQGIMATVVPALINAMASALLLKWVQNIGYEKAGSRNTAKYAYGVTTVVLFTDMAAKVSCFILGKPWMIRWSLFWQLITEVGVRAFGHYKIAFGAHDGREPLLRGSADSVRIQQHDGLIGRVVRNWTLNFG